MVPVVGVDHAPTTAFTTEAYALSQHPLISVPVSGPTLVPKQLGPTGGRGLETLPTVSDHAVLTIVIADYWLFSICPRCLIL